MLFEQIAEIVRILITDVKRNIAHAAVSLDQQMLCRLDADSGQIFDKGLTGLLRKHGGKMVWTEPDLCRHHVQRNTAVRIIFADKLLCTADLRAVSHILHVLHPGQVYFTPIEAALPDLDPAGIAFHGTADPWARTELITEGCRRLGVPLHLTENADHSMETGDVLRNITILHTILEYARRRRRWRFCKS